jgi:molybdopterin converting factor subunit 1
MTTVHVQYYAVLREQAGLSEERVVTGATTAAALYEELRARHRLALAPGQLRVAIDGEFADWQAPLADGARVVFIPPVAGG